MFILLFITTLCIGAADLSDVTHYEVLGVAKQATTQEIRQAYKKLAIKFHPDKNPDSKEQEMFLKITAAYETLKDPDKRHKYDTYGSYSTYTRKYDHHSQSEYNNLFYNGLYHEDPFVDTLSSGSFSNYLQDGLYFINFYSPFCPPCQHLSDTWKKLAELYKGVIKVGAVNCKYYINFCYSMRIGSYPTLLFYPNGKDGNFVYYRGERSLEALEKFLLPFVVRATGALGHGALGQKGAPVAYVLRSALDSGALARIAYQLRGLVTLTVVDSAFLRELSSGGPAVLVVGPSRVPLRGDEGALLRGLADALPTEDVDQDRFQRIMDELRLGLGSPWAVHFRSETQLRLPMHRLRVQLQDVHFGEVDCTRSLRLCLSLRVSPGKWAVLKRGGAIQTLGGGANDAPPPALLRAAAAASALHSLDEDRFKRILDGEEGTWALLVLPWGKPAEPLAEQFTLASLHFDEHTDICFGIVECSSSSELCGGVATGEGGVVLQKGAGLHPHAGPITEGELVDFIRLVLDTEDVELNEQEVLGLMSPGGRGPEGWLLGFFPQGCGGDCAQLLVQWRMVAQKLRPLTSLRVGLLQCGGGEGGGARGGGVEGAGLCPNVRIASARYYAPGESQPQTASLEQLSLAPHMEQWALRRALAPPTDLGGGAYHAHIHGHALHQRVRPWLVYFHSPRCFRCHEMYADFAIAGHLLGDAVQLGTVNCWTDRGLCQQEQVGSYPSLRLFLRGRRVSLQVAPHQELLGQLGPLLRAQDQLGPSLGVGSYHVTHDEF